MKITVKTIQQKVFTIDAEPTDTIGDLKKKIQESHGHAPETQKLIYSGKILPDSKTLESCEVKEKDFFVLMVSKPKAAPAPAASTSAAAAPVTAAAPTPVAAPAAAPVPASTPVAPTPAETAAAPTTEPTTTGSGTSGSSFLTGPALQASISSMVDMGFDREQVMRALRASFNNPDRAIEYLINGIPEGLEGIAAPGGGPPPAAPVIPPASTPAAAAAAPAPASPPAPAAPATNTPQNLFQLAQQAQGQQPTGGLPAGLGAGADAGGQLPPQLASLANSPAMAQIRQMMRENPGMLQPLLQQLIASNPQIAAQLQANPQALSQLFPGLDDDMEGDDGEGGDIPGVHTIRVTEEEQAAIAELEAFGFSRQQAIEAFLICDKNKEMAANYLFEQFGPDNQDQSS